MAKDYDKVIVEGPSSSKYLYEFADEYIENEIVPHTSDEYKGRCQRNIRPTQGATVLKPNSRVCQLEKRKLRGNFHKDPDKEWRCLSSHSEYVADVTLAFRSAKKFRGRMLYDKEYPIQRCTELVQLLLDRGLTVVCIGGKDNYHVSGAVDLRGAPLEKQCAVLAGSKVCVGPSSGPLHLASLCKVPHVVWYNRPDRRLSKPRYRDFWNPFQTPHTYMSQQLPTPSEVVSAMLEYLP